jgi:hypothetical protein
MSKLTRQGPFIDGTSVIDVIAKLIELTQAGRISWEAVPTVGVGLPLKTHDRWAEDVYQAAYKEHRLRIYRDVRKNPGSLTEAVLSGMGTSIHVVPPTMIQLQLVDTQGNAVWTFPQTTSQEDLMKAIKYKVAGVSDFFESVMKE